jgi:MFS superfamily sulfate permease-like transporter/CRP-like cAMP-binding protein
MPPRSLLTPALQSGDGAERPQDCAAAANDEENPPPQRGSSSSSRVPIPGASARAAQQQQSYYPSPAVAASFGGGGAPLLSSSLAQSRFLVGEHIASQFGGGGARERASGAVASAAASFSRRRSDGADGGQQQQPLTTPLLGGGQAAAIFGSGPSTTTTSRRPSFERERSALLYGGAGGASATAAAATAPTPIPPPSPPPSYSLAQAQAQAAHDPVVAAAIADTAAQLAQQQQQQEEEEEAQEAEAAAQADNAYKPAPPPPGRLGRLFRKLTGGPTAQTDAIYGLINAVVGVPTMVSFAAIVFAHPTYRPFLGQLARLSFLSAAAHQIIFALFSSLPFAVGQPQDTGLIVLSAIATSVADYGLEKALSARVVLATALVTLSAATLVVGLLTLSVARLKLAGLVQYVPLPVVGGYLSFVGWFCLTAGLGLGTGTEISGSPATWGALLASDALVKLGPTLLAAAAMLTCMRRARSPWALPVLLLCIPLAFHAVLLLTGTTLAQAQDAGWVLKPPESGGGGGQAGGSGSGSAALGVGGHVGGHGGGHGADPSSSSSSSSSSLEPFWDLFKLYFSGSGIALPAMLRQAPRVVALWLVVVFGSTLDVAAIQCSTPRPIDFDAELATVGISNIANALLFQQYTGSYIFSQTLFSMRAGVSGSLHGFVLGGLELVVFLLPFPVVQVMPVFFFGALLVVFGVEIAGDWLVHSRHKVTRAEYALLLLTFALIVQLGLEYGVAAGGVACLLYFAASYSRVHVSAFRAVASRSAAARPLREHRALEGAFAGRMAAVSLSGFIFFGSAIKIMDKVMAFAKEEMLQGEEEGAEGEDGGGVGVGGGGGGGGSAFASGVGGVGGVGGTSTTTTTTTTDSNDLLLRRVAAGAPRFLLLDFRRVLGVDATAAQTFGSLRMQLRRLGIELVLTRVHGNPTVERLFAAHGLIIAPSVAVGAGAAGAASAAKGDDVSDGGAAPPWGEAGGGRGDDDRSGGLGADDGAASPSSSPSSPYPYYCRAFDTLNDGCVYCEERFLALARAAGALPAQDVALTLREFLEGHLLVGGGGGGGGGGGRGGGGGGWGGDGEGEEGEAEEQEAAMSSKGKGKAKGVKEKDGGAAAADLSSSPPDGERGAGGTPSFGFAALGGSRRAVDEAARGIEQHSAVARFAPGEVLFDYGAAPDVVYLVLRGAVDVEVHGAGEKGGAGGGINATTTTTTTTPAAAALESAAASFPHGAGGPAAVPPMPTSSSSARRHYQCGVGAVVGGTDAVLQRPRAYRAVAASAVEAVAIRSGGYRRMARERPAAARALQAILLRDACLSEVYAYEALRRAAD